MSGGWKIAPNAGPRLSTVLAFSPKVEVGGAGSARTSGASSAAHPLPMTATLSASSSPSDTSAAPQSDPLVRHPILLLGDDLGWLAGQRELAGRKIVLGDPGADALTLLASERFEVVLASYKDLNQSLLLLRAAAATSPAPVALLRADGKELAGVSNPYPVLPRVDSVEVLDDQLRTRLAAAAWQASPDFVALTNRITKVPTLPSIYTQVTAALQSPDASIEDIAALVAREPAVSAKLLQMVNSPLLGLRGRVTSVRDATNLLGLSRLRSLVLATSLFRQFDGVKCPSFSMSRFEAHSLQIASWASSIAKSESRDRQVADMAFTASLLHNFGVLLLAANLPEQYDQVLRTAQEQRVSIAWTELQTFGATHAEIAGAVLASWGIPFPIVNAVGRYPAPSASDDTEFSPLTALHAATAVDAFTRTGMQNFDRDYLERLHLGRKMEEWCVSVPEISDAA